MVVWSTEMINDFHNLCNELCSSCVLTIPLCRDKFIVQTDASGKGISGILSVCRNGAELPVAFFSRQLRGAERNYAASELECLKQSDTFRFIFMVEILQSKLITEHWNIFSHLTS